MIRVLDLFCGAGGCSRGYYDGFTAAGLDVYIVGVDFRPQPNYCGDEFVQADAMTFPLDGFDFIHASPPCHDHSTVSGRNRKASGPKGTGWMLEATFDRLAANGVPWVVENVATAQAPAGIYKVQLCGSSFGLDLRRHRWFWSDTGLLVPPCDHSWQEPRFRSLDSRRAGKLSTVIGVHGHLNYPGELELRKQAMGIEWMTNSELTQAIPPAYTAFLAGQVAPALTGVAA